MPIPIIVQRVRQHAARAPDEAALKWPEKDYDRSDPSWRSVTWGELEARSDGLARGLRHRGVGASERVAVFLRAGPEWLALVLACWKVGATAVVTSRRLEARHALQAVRRARPRVLVGSAWLHRLRPWFREAFASVEVTVATGAPWLWGGSRLSELAKDGDPLPLPDGDALAILELVGDGPARGLTDRHLLARTPVSDDDAGLTLETTWARVFGHLAAGRTSVWPRLDPQRPSSVQTDAWLAALTHHDVELLVGGPEVFGRPVPEGFVARASRAVAVGRPLAGGWMLRWSQLLDGPGSLAAGWQTPETGVVARIVARELRAETLDKTRRGAGYCVGRPVDGVSVDIVDITDGPLVGLEEARMPPGEMGEIVVAGPGVVLDYPIDEEHQDRVVIDDQWLRTGWLGYLDEDGRLWLGGRVEDRVETASGLVTPLSVEGLFDGDGDVVRCALVGVGPRGSALPVLVVQLREGRTLSAGLEAGWRDREADTAVRGVVRRYLAHPAMPVTGDRSPDREVLRGWAEQRCADLVREDG